MRQMIILFAFLQASVAKLTVPELVQQFANVKKLSLGDVSFLPNPTDAASVSLLLSFVPRVLVLLVRDMQKMAQTIISSRNKPQNVVSQIKASVASLYERCRTASTQFQVNLRYMDDHNESVYWNNVPWRFTQILSDHKPLKRMKAELHELLRETLERLLAKPVAQKQLAEAFPETVNLFNNQSLISEFRRLLQTYGWIPCAPVIVCPSEWTYFEATRSCYKTFFGGDWSTAELSCISMGAHLVSIHSEEENNFVISMAESSLTLVSGWTWIGLRSALPGVWMWSDGTKFDFTKWSPEHPIAGNACTELIADHYINDDSITYKWYSWTCAQVEETTRNYVCKKRASN